MLQRQECCSKPESSLLEKPPFLSDQHWVTFHSKVSTAISKMWGPKLALMCLLAIPVILVSMHAPIPGKGHVAVTIVKTVVEHLLFIALIVGPRMITVKKNEKQDTVIRDACAELSKQTGISIEYRTRYTGFCKPKGALPFRAIAFGPVAGQAPVPVFPSVMSVQVPQGSGPGTKLQVQSPSGQILEVVVPPGTSAGQIFQVSLPAPTPVAATLVVATPFIAVEGP